MSYCRMLVVLLVAAALFCVAPAPRAEACHGFRPLRAAGRALGWVARKARHPLQDARR